MQAIPSIPSPPSDWYQKKKEERSRVAIGGKWSVLYYHEQSDVNEWVRTVHTRGSDTRALTTAIGSSYHSPIFAVAASGDSRVSGRAPGRFCRPRILHDLFSSCSIFSTVSGPYTFLHPTHSLSPPCSRLERFRVHCTMGGESRKPGQGVENGEAIKGRL